MIGPRWVLLVLGGSSQVPSEAVQVLSQALQGGGGRGLGLWSVTVTFKIWIGRYHIDRARRGWGFSGAVVTMVLAWH